MGIFDNLDNVQPQEERNRKLEPGTYTVEITKVLSKVSQERGVDLFIVEMKVITSTHPAFKAGDTAGWVQKCQDPKVYKPAIAGFVVATLGYSQHDPKVAGEILPRMSQFALAAATKGILEKMHVCVDVKQTKTKGGFDFRLHSWRAACSPEENAARRAA